MVKIHGHLASYRFFAVIGIAGALQGVPGITIAGPDEATKERCAAYAKRAVEQYQLMKSHPGCDQHLDALSWRDDYGYHYNGCIVFGNTATTLSDQARDGHLRACGAIVDSGIAPAASTGGASATASTSQAVATGTAPTDSAAALPANADGGSGDSLASLLAPAPHYGGIGCHVGPALPAGRASGSGRVTDLKGAALSYRAFPPVSATNTAQAMWATANTYPLVTAVVARPPYLSSCTGIPAVSALGPWVSAGGLGQSPRYIWVDVGGVLAWQELTPAEATALIKTGKLPPAATGTTAPTAAKTIAPAKAAQSKSH